MNDENLKLKNMETRRINTFLLATMSIMLSLIAWGGNNYYQNQKSFNDSWSKKMTDFDKNQIIIEYRIGTLEVLHDIDNPTLR